MVSKEILKREVDNLPDNLLDEVYALLRKILNRKSNSDSGQAIQKLKDSINKFTPDYLSDRVEVQAQKRESFDE
jgi:hypothetical protein